MPVVVLGAESTNVTVSTQSPWTNALFTIYADAWIVKESALPSVAFALLTTVKPVSEIVKTPEF